MCHEKNATALTGGFFLAFFRASRGMAGGKATPPPPPCDSCVQVNLNIYIPIPPIGVSVYRKMVLSDFYKLFPYFTNTLEPQNY